MKKRSLLMFSGILVVLFLCSSSTFAVVGVPDNANRHVPGEVIVGFSPQANFWQINGVVSSIGGKIMAKHNGRKARMTRIKLPSSGLSVEEVVADLKSNPAYTSVIKYVEPNMVRKAMGVRGPGGDVGIMSQSSDPLQRNQWGYYDIAANWLNAPTTTVGVTVAVIDTGVDYNHPDLVKKVTKGYDYINADTNPMDDYGHGTHVSGIIAAKANNSYGISGVSWNAKIYAIKALNSTGWGNSYDIASAIIAAANNGSVKIINMSLGGPYSFAEDDAVDYAVNSKNKLVVASAGNNNTSDPDAWGAYPAALSVDYPNRVIAVAAHGQDHCKASFSNYGSWVSITAPGVDILSTLPPYMYPDNAGFEEWSGTSMAAPHVSAAAALAWERNPTYTNEQIGILITTLGNTDLPLNRDGACWPDDGTTFRMLSVLHFLEQQYFELCDNKGGIYGTALDAETGLPVAGAKVTTKQGTKVTGTDYVPYYGTANNFDDLSLFDEGYGLFNILTPIGNETLTIQKSLYMTISPVDQNGLATPIPVTACDWTNAGNIPVPPAKSYYWFAVTWNQGYTDARYDLYVDVWQYDNETPYNTYFWQNTGSLSAFPYVRHLWDSDLDQGDSRDYMETIRISKTIPGGRYNFYVQDWVNMEGSTNWAESGIKAYLFKGNKLIRTYTPPPGGAGAYWVIADVTATTVTELNNVTDDWPIY